MADIRLELSESQFDRAKSYKESHNLTWKELLLRSVPPEESLTAHRGERIDCLLESHGKEAHQSPVMFSKQNINQKYIITSNKKDMQINQFQSIIEDLSRYCNIDMNSGGWSIVQASDHTWTGLGVETLMNALRETNRTQPADHHREELCWIGPGGRSHSSTLVTGQPHPEGDYVERVRVSLITDAIPMSPKFSELLETLPVEYSTIEPLSADEYNGSVRSLNPQIEGYLTELSMDNQTDRLKIKNPWTDDPKSLQREFEGIPIETAREIASLDSLVVDVRMAFYKSEEVSAFDVKRSRIQSLTVGHTEGINVDIQLDPVLA